MLRVMLRVKMLKLNHTRGHAEGNDVEGDDVEGMMLRVMTLRVVMPKMMMFRVAMLTVTTLEPEMPMLKMSGVLRMRAEILWAR